MRSTWAKMALVAVLATTALGLGSRAIAQQASDLRVFVNLKDADMVTATRTLTQQAGVQFIIEPSSEPFGRVTLKLDGQTAEDAVRYICQAAGAYFRRDENGVFIISHRKPELPVVTTPVAKKVVRKLKILKAGARDVFDAIVRDQAFDSSRGFEELRRYTKLTMGDVGRIWGTNSDGTPATPNQVYKPVSTVDAVSARPLTGAESGSDIQLPGEEANQIGGRGGGGIGGGFGGGQPGGGRGGIGGGGVGGGGIGGGGIGGGGQNAGNLLQPGEGTLIPEGITYINYDPVDNSLVVQGTEQAIADLQQRIGIFDVVPRQVNIRVEFITTTARLQNDIGYNFSYNRGAFVTGFLPSLPSGPGSSFLSWGTGNWAARLRATLTENNGTTVQAPQLTTMNNVPASASFLSVIYIFISTTSQSTTSTVTNVTPYPIPIQTFLSVTPRINDDDTVTMFLNPQISDVTGFSVGPDGQQVPNQTSQAISVVARVHNDQTIVLAGFNGKNYSTTVTRVPVLSDIPIIGQFFRSRTRSNTNSELLIFVTPHILTEEEMAGPAGP